MACFSLHDRVLGLARDLVLERYGVDLGAQTTDPAVVRLQSATEAAARGLDHALEAFDAELFDEALAGLGQEHARLERTSGETLPTHAQTLGTRLSLFSSPTAQRSAPGSDPPLALEPSDAQLFDEALMGLGGDRPTVALVTQEDKTRTPASMLLFSSPGPASR